MIFQPATNLLTKSGGWKFMGSSVVVSCPLCGRIHDLDGFTVFDDGTVYPTFVCYNVLCPFDETITLRGWHDNHSS